MNRRVFRKMMAITFIMVSAFLVSIGDVIAGWTAMSSGTTEYLTDVGGCSGSDVFAVGENGTIVHYDGSNWSAMSSGTTAHLYGVWCNSGGDVFVVGGSDTILHYDGTTWTAMSSGTTTASFSDVWGNSGSDVFVVGSSGTVLHYNGTSWSTMSSATGESLSGVWGSSGSDVFAVGDNSIKVHYNGTSWSAMPPATTGSLDGIWGSSGSDVFAVGAGGTIIHYDGTTWTAMSSGTTTDSFSDVWGSSGTDVFAVSRPIFYYDGTSWSEMADGSSWSPWNLNGIWGSSGSDVFAVGGGGNILHYDGNPAPASTTTSAMTTTTTSPQSFAVAGTITGAISANIPVELLGDASQMVQTDNNGHYEFVNLTAGGSYGIIPQLEGYVFEPPEHGIENLAMDELDINFVASVAPLCPTEIIYGEDSEETELLRSFRDYVLSETPEGREIIRLYYQWSPVVVKAMEEDKVFEEEVRAMIDGVLLLIGGGE